jgi:hypothetical protein
MVGSSDFVRLLVRSPDLSSPKALIEVWARDVLPLVRVESSSAPPLQCARRLLDSIESGGTVQRKVDFYAFFMNLRRR